MNTRQLTAAVMAAVAATSLAGCRVEVGTDKPSQTASSQPTSSATDSSSSAEPSAGYEPSSQPVGRAGKPRGLKKDYDDVDTRSAKAVCHAYAVTAYTQDSRIDNSPNDAQRRAKRWMTSRLADQIAGPVAGRGSDATWQAMKAADGYTSATAKPVQSPGKSTSTRARCGEWVRVHTTSAQGVALSTDQELFIFLTLVRANSVAPWRISQITTN